MPKHKTKKPARRIAGKAKARGVKRPLRKTSRAPKAMPMPTREQLEALEHEDVVRQTEKGCIEIDLILPAHGRSSVRFLDWDTPGLLVRGDLLATDTVMFREAAKYLSQAIVPIAHQLAEQLAHLADSCDRALKGEHPVTKGEGPQQNYESDPGAGRAHDG
jgi:hypothetical protein